MENHSASQIVGNPSAPYINSLAKSCGLATDYTAISHPSLPNYIAATSGDTHGIADDGSPSSHPLAVPSIFGQAASAKSYEQSMPAPCARSDSGRYVVKHNPAVYYTRLAANCTRTNLPLGALAGALTRNKLPAFSFVTPDLCSDMHDCSVSAGDSWLKRWVLAITAGPAYKAGGTVLFIVWDEADNDAANTVPALVVSPYTRAGTRSGAAFTHYSLLRTTEDLLHIPTRLGNAATAASMRAAFGL